MRRNARVIAIALSGGILLGACDKPESKPVPEPATAQVSKIEPTPAATPTTPSKPNLEQKPPSSIQLRGPSNRVEAMQTTVSKMESGDFREAFKYLAPGIIWTAVGLPDGELETVENVVSYHQRSRTGFSDFRLKAERIIDADDYQVVEYVWSARHSGAFADGTPATNKVATLPGAMLVRYQKDGLIDRVWDFQDSPNLLRQLGLANELPADFKPFPLPERTDLVSGPSDAKLRKRYEAFLSRLAPDDYRVMLAEHVAADFGWRNPGTGAVLNGLDAINTYLAHTMQSFVPESTTVETAVGAGTYFAAYTTSVSIYKGGFMNVPASDQRVTTHTLDILQFDGSDMLFKKLARYGNSYEILAALEVTAGAAARPMAEDKRFKISICDKYVFDMRACIDSLDGVARETARTALDQQIVRWQSDKNNGVPLELMKTSCQGRVGVAKETVASACPRVTWD